MRVPSWLQQEFPAVFKILRDRTWREDFDSRTLKRADQQFEPHHFHELNCQKNLHGPELSASVKGSRASPYFTEVSFEVSARRSDFFFLESWCSCPVGSGCKHAAALLSRCSDLLEADSARIHADQADPLGAWLARLRSHTSDVDVEIPQRSFGEPFPPSSRFLFYGLRKGPQQQLDLTLHTGQTTQSGHLTINFKSTARADPLRPPAYMTAEDIRLCSLRERVIHQLRYQSTSFFEHQDATPLLLELLKTGRLITENASPSSGQPWTFLIEGPAITPEPGWGPASPGRIRPALTEVPDTFPEDLSLLLPTSPPYFLDRSSDPAQLRPVEFTRHSRQFLNDWLIGPTLEEKDTLISARALLTQDSTLPLPLPHEPERVTGLQPIPALHLARSRPPLSRRTPATVTLTFRYGDYQTSPGPARETFAAINDSDQKVISISRNLEEEKRLLQELLAELPLTSTSKAPHLLIPEHQAEVPAWQTVLNLAQSLRQLSGERNWSLTIDPDCDLRVDTIPSYALTSILTPKDDGDPQINWFHFQASWITPEGTEESLLPFLTLFLQQLNPEEVGSLLDSTPESDQTVLPNPKSPQHFLSFPTLRLLQLAQSLFQLFGGIPSADEPLHRLQAAALADALNLDSDQTARDLAKLGQQLSQITELPQPKLPRSLRADLRPYQLQGFYWMQFLARHQLHGILADDMGLGKTLQALTHLQAEVTSRRSQRQPSLVLAPTSVISNWQREAERFTPNLKTLLLHGPDRHEHFPAISNHHLVITSYPLLVRDFPKLKKLKFHLVILDEAQTIKNPAAKVSQAVCQLQSSHRLSLSGTPLENHLGELWSQFRFLMPGLLGSQEVFTKTFRSPIERHQDSEAQLRLGARIAPLILRRTKDEVASELPPKTEMIHRISLGQKQIDLYETVRAAMDSGIQEAIAHKGLAKSHIIVLSALLRLRQICCHPQMIDLSSARQVQESAKTTYFLETLLPTLLAEGRKILVFSTFTKMLSLLEKEFQKRGFSYSKITGATRKRDVQIENFQHGKADLFLISLKAGGTGLNLTAADTVIHYDPWWNPAAENQATDRAHRIGQKKPVFVHKLIVQGSIEERILELQTRKSKIVEALLSEETRQLRLDQQTLSHLLAPLE